SAIYKDSDAGDIATDYAIEVSTDPLFTDSLQTVYASGKTPTVSPLIESNRSTDIAIPDTSISDSNTYYWRIKFWDVQDNEGAWSTIHSFSIADLTAPTITATSPTLGAT